MHPRINWSSWSSISSCCNKEIGRRWTGSAATTTIHAQLRIHCEPRQVYNMILPNIALLTDLAKLSGGVFCSTTNMNAGRAYIKEASETAGKNNRNCITFSWHPLTSSSCYQKLFGVLSRSSATRPRLCFAFHMQQACTAYSTEMPAHGCRILLAKFSYRYDCSTRLRQSKETRAIGKL